MRLAFDCCKGGLWCSDWSFAVNNLRFMTEVETLDRLINSLKHFIARRWVSGWERRDCRAQSAYFRGRGGINGQWLKSTNKKTRHAVRRSGKSPFIISQRRQLLLVTSEMTHILLQSWQALKQKPYQNAASYKALKTWLMQHSSS